MPICATCGQENPDVARFCLACGAALGVDEAAPNEERRFISVLFVDLVGFTARAEKLDPEDVRAILTPYHETVRQEIESFGGVVEKFVGDAVMSVFGAPVAYGDDAERAVRAAFGVLDSLDELNRERPGLDLRARAAVNTGEAAVLVGTQPGSAGHLAPGHVANTAP